MSHYGLARCADCANTDNFDIRQCLFMSAFMAAFPGVSIFLAYKISTNLHVHLHMYMLVAGLTQLFLHSTLISITCSTPNREW